jgi:hypothetical protein
MGTNQFASFPVIPPGTQRGPLPAFAFPLIGLRDPIIWDVLGQFDAGQGLDGRLGPVEFSLIKADALVRFLRQNVQAKINAPIVMTAGAEENCRCPSCGAISITLDATPPSFNPLIFDFGGQTSPTSPPATPSVACGSGFLPFEILAIFDQAAVNKHISSDGFTLDDRVRFGPKSGADETCVACAAETPIPNLSIVTIVPSAPNQIRADFVPGEIPAGSQVRFWIYAEPAATPGAACGEFFGPFCFGTCNQVAVVSLTDSVVAGTQDPLTLVFDRPVVLQGPPPLPGTRVFNKDNTEILGAWAPALDGGPTDTWVFTPAAPWAIVAGPSDSRVQWQINNGPCAQLDSTSFLILSA